MQHQQNFIVLICIELDAEPSIREELESCNNLIFPKGLTFVKWQIWALWEFAAWTDSREMKQLHITAFRDQA